MVDKLCLPRCGSCFSVYPLSFNGCFTVEEKLCKIQYTINQIINELSRDDSWIIETIESMVNAAEEKMKSYTDSEISKLYQKILIEIKSIKDFVEYSNSSFSAYINSQISRLENEIKNIPVTDCLLINPFSGKIDSIQNIVNDLYNNFKYFAFTCEEYDSSNITCGEYKESGITCGEYSFYGKIFFKRKLISNMFKMFNPVSGLNEDFRQTIRWLISQHQNCLTCAEYSATNITCEEYSEKDITCYEYSFESKSIIS